MATILLVEDDAQLAYALSRSLTIAGHQVITALNGMSAIETLDTDVRIDVLLADIVMPTGHPHGVALARMAQQKRRDLKVILMTGHPELRSEIGQYQFLLKPVAAELVIDAIDRALGKPSRP